MRQRNVSSLLKTKAMGSWGSNSQNVVLGNYMIVDFVNWAF